MTQLIDEVREMFDERFMRMWDIYLSSCAATFHNEIIDLHQILLANEINNDLPQVRWC
ncbi:MAG: class I SAM-dependent methyltransferase [Schaedlerella sp.]